jgi:hypothetical protein
LLVKSNDYCTGKDSCVESEKEEELSSRRFYFFFSLSPGGIVKKNGVAELPRGKGNDNEENPIEPEEDPEEPKGNSNKKQD